ncbi:Hypothetical predicted protein [Cloeon dipterum]|uniref:Uncharacterized protein n=1 Tax=Cloeon dipterum TaxID=197152 RepID=A0A8S1CFR6_9INSE|nr:Hypothetical predicted protein [Cloeon dipterum]
MRLRKSEPEKANAKVNQKPYKANHTEQTLEQAKGHKKLYLAALAVILFLACVSLMFSTQYSISKEPIHKVAPKINSKKPIADKPVLFIRASEFPRILFHHVSSVFQRLGYKVTFNGKDDWDVMWTHSDPFDEFPPDKLKAHQLVNKVPGIRFLTSKLHLAIAGGPGIPPSFQLLEDKEKFLKYVEENPKDKFLVKGNTHGMVKLQPFNEINLHSSSRTTFIQKFIDNPLLIDGHFFDFGVYVIVTSVNPLRVYRLENDLGYRFCKEPYHPLDANNTAQYVVGDFNFWPSVEFPASKKYLDASYSFKYALDANIAEAGKDPKRMWEQVDKLIIRAFLHREKNILSVFKDAKHKRSFFELVQFDFIVDENLNVYLTEVNMSPNLSSAQYPPYAIKYEQVLFSLLSLVGLASFIHPPHQNEQMAKDMTVANRNIMVYRDVCVECNDCSKFECKLCVTCLEDDFAEDLKMAYKENMNKYEAKRLFPPKMTQEEAKFGIPTEYSNLSEKNLLQFRWYQGKCLVDDSWC